MPSNLHRNNAFRDVIDVDEFHSRYEDPEGLVQLISREEFRKSRHTPHQERVISRSADRGGSRSAVTKSSGRQQRGQSTTTTQVRRDIPSTLGNSVQKTMSQKRPLSSESVPAPQASKRQRADVGPSRLRDSTDEWPTIPVTSSPNLLRRQPSPAPDFMIVDERPRQRQSFKAMSSDVAKSFLKHRTSSPKQDSQPASKTSATLTPRQAEKQRMEVIELFSDDESNRPTIESTQNHDRSASIPQQCNSPIEFSSESEHSDDDWNPPGLDLNDPDVWLPVSNNVHKEDGVFHSLENLSIYSPPPLPRYRCQDTSRWPPPPPPLKQLPYVWDKLRLAENLRWRPRPRSILMQPTKLITRPKDIDFNLHKLKTVASFKQAPGTINAIEQFEGLTAIGSACDGGLADAPDETPSPYNRPGSLSVWSDNSLAILDGHMRRGLQPKHYTINDIKFDPISNSFASIGEDKRCRVWFLDDESEQSKWKCTVTFRYAFVPHVLAFRPGSCILAVAEKKVLVYDLSEEVITPPHQFSLHDKRSPHTIGSIAWGCETTADHLFASSEPTQPTFTGAHKVFDLRTLKTIYEFDAEEAGDVLAIDPAGATLGLCTQAEANHHILRLYDIRRRDPRAFASLDVLPFDKGGNFEGEMNIATFSPDQLYLALARNDNQTHIYDRRMLGKQSSEPLFKYCHFGESKTVSESYGVVQARWLQSPGTTRTCLVTGGEDGCVRMWDPSIAAHNVENGKVLAEVNYDISQFSIGDPFAGEYRLVVGNSSGEVTIFDHICGSDI